MQIDKNSSTKLINLISQTIITNIDDIPIDMEPNRIKEKKESLKNTLENRLNIPISNSYKQDYIVDRTPMYTIIDARLDEIEDGKKKPINVKNPMLENIKKSSFIENINIAEPSDGKIKQPEQFISREQNIERLMVELDKFKEEIDSKLKKIQQKKSEIEDSNMVIKELSTKYDEIEIKLKEAESKNMQLEQQIVLHLNDRISSLNNQLMDVNKLSEEISRKQEENNSRIIEFREKIDSTQEKINKVNDKIAKKEQMLDFFYNEKLEKNIKNESYEKEEQVKRIPNS